MYVLVGRNACNTNFVLVSIESLSVESVSVEQLSGLVSKGKLTNIALFTIVDGKITLKGMNDALGRYGVVGVDNTPVIVKVGKGYELGSTNRTVKEYVVSSPMGRIAKYTKVHAMPLFELKGVANGEVTRRKGIVSVQPINGAYPIYSIDEEICKGVDITLVEGVKRSGTRLMYISKGARGGLILLLNRDTYKRYMVSKETYMELLKNGLIFNVVMEKRGYIHAIDANLNNYCNRDDGYSRRDSAYYLSKQIILRIGVLKGTDKRKGIEYILCDSFGEVKRVSGEEYLSKILPIISPTHHLLVNGKPRVTKEGLNYICSLKGNYEYYIVDSKPVEGVEVLN